jgi:hypothetical protein
MPTPAQTKTAEYKRRFGLAARTAKWAVTMTKVRIRQAVVKTPYPRWHFISFTGPTGVESKGVVDLIAVRKDHHSTPQAGLKHGDAFQMILIQVKGGSAAPPTSKDVDRLRLVAQRHNADRILFAAWKKGSAARFFSES